MEIKVIKEEKNKIIFEIEGEDHTLANALRKELWNDKKVKAAGYQIEHPLIGMPKMIVETSSGSPKTAVKDAADRLKKLNAKLKEEIKKEIK